MKRIFVTVIFLMAVAFSTGCDPEMLEILEEMTNDGDFGSSSNSDLNSDTDTSANSGSEIGSVTVDINIAMGGFEIIDGITFESVVEHKGHECPFDISSGYYRCELINLPANSYIIEFEDVNGFNTIEDIAFVLENEEELVFTGKYTI